MDFSFFSLMSKRYSNLETWKTDIPVFFFCFLYFSRVEIKSDDLSFPLHFVDEYPI